MFVCFFVVGCGIVYACYLSILPHAAHKSITKLNNQNKKTVQRRKIKYFLFLFRIVFKLELVNYKVGNMIIKYNEWIFSLKSLWKMLYICRYLDNDVDTDIQTFCSVWVVLLWRSLPSFSLCREKCLLFRWPSSICLAPLKPPLPRRSPVSSKDQWHTPEDRRRLPSRTRTVFVGSH